MKNINKIFSTISKKLDELDSVREEILKLSRQMIRNCSIAIKSIHRNEFKQYQEKIEEIKANHFELKKLINNNENIFHNYLKTPEQEYIEAISLYSLINDQDIPSPENIGVDPINYLLGLSDVIGELRRHILDKIRHEEVDDLEKILNKMETIHSFLFSLDYPKAITHDLRRKTDVARGIIKRTRGDISLSIQINRLNKNLEKK